MAEAEYQVRYTDLVFSMDKTPISPLFPESATRFREKALRFCNPVKTTEGVLVQYRLMSLPFSLAGQLPRLLDQT